MMRKIDCLYRHKGGLDGLLPHGPSEGYMEKFPYTQAFGSASSQPTMYL
jgi:hypothetical protein